MEGHLLLFAPHQGVHDVAAAGVTAAVTEAPLGRFTHHKTLRVTDPTVAAARGVPPTLEAAAHSSRAPRDSRPQTGAPRLPVLLDSLVDCQPGPQVVLQLGLAGQCEGVVFLIPILNIKTNNVHCVTLSGGKTYSDPFSSSSRKVRV